MLHNPMTAPTWNLQPGDILVREQIHGQYGGNPQAGIPRLSSTPNSLVNAALGGKRLGRDSTATRSPAGRSGRSAVQRSRSARLNRMRFWIVLLIGPEVLATEKHDRRS